MMNLTHFDSIFSANTSQILLDENRGSVELGIRKFRAGLLRETLHAVDENGNEHAVVLQHTNIVAAEQLETTCRSFVKFVARCWQSCSAGATEHCSVLLSSTARTTCSVLKAVFHFVIQLSNFLFLQRV